MQYGMVIDTERCFGCHTCSVSCKQANNLPNDIWWNRVLTDGGDFMDTATGTYPTDLELDLLPLSCQHCENPSCVRVCPVGATFKDEETGIVRQDYDKCIGCRMCMAACPYNGVRSFNWEDPEYSLDYAVGDADIAEHQKHAVEKCTFCYQRLERGEKPACMVLCPSRARYYGDLDDPDSEVSELVRKRASKQVLLNEGTNPSVYYLIG